MFVHMNHIRSSLDGWFAYPNYNIWCFSPFFCFLKAACFVLTTVFLTFSNVYCWHDFQWIILPIPIVFVFSFGQFADDVIYSLSSVSLKRQQLRFYVSLYPHYSMFSFSSRSGFPDIFFQSAPPFGTDTLSIFLCQIVFWILYRIHDLEQGSICR